MLIFTVIALQVTVIADKPARRIPVTPEHIATAFKDARAQALFTRAREARLEQDSSLSSYDATILERMGMGVTMGETGRERALYRYETAARVRWQREIGAYVDLTGARLGIPVAGAQAERGELISNLANGEIGKVPYFPGQESLWMGRVVGNNTINDRAIVNPLAEGAEAYYTYESGDSIAYTLDDSRVVQLRELKVRPRAPAWNTAVGSLQIDIASGQVVAAIYRMSAVQDVYESMKDAMDDTAKVARLAVGVIKAVAPNVESDFSEVVVEYALHEGRFWLPRTRMWKGSMRVSSVSVPARMEQAITYSRVNGPMFLAPIVPNTRRFPFFAPDSIRGDTARKQWRDSVHALRRQQESTFKALVRSEACDSTGVQTRALYDSAAKLAIAIRHPCDIDKLINSPDISKSPYAADDSLFNHANLDALVNQALGLASQAAFNLLKPKATWHYGLSMSRYNRVEGFSTGIGLDQQFGGGYIASTSARFAFGEREASGELSLARTNGRKTITLGGYHRLESVSDWGSPFSATASISSFFFARDEGFYYRTTGGELTYKTGSEWRVGVRAFAERQREAQQSTSFSVAGDFRPNIIAAPINSFGASLRMRHDFGSNPRGSRAFTDLRLEGAGGDSTYGRGALELTVSQGLPANLAAALTLAAGSSIGGLPQQRLWYLGGRETIRGQRANATQSDNAFWMSRMEIGKDFRPMRLSLFGDIGWVGDRDTNMREIGRPMSGVGIGTSFLDGLARLDLSRGLFPSEKFRVQLSLGARW